MVTGICLHTLKGHSNLIWHIVFLEPFIFSCSGDHTIRIWVTRKKNLKYLILIF